VAVKWNLGDEEHAHKAILLLTRFARGQTDLFAPDYIRYEVPSAITVATQGRGARITQVQGKEAIEEFLNLGVRTVDSGRLALISKDNNCWGFFTAFPGCSITKCRGARSVMHELK